MNDVGDAADATPGDNICATAGAVCTLRAAIEEANAHAGSDTIVFSIAGTITPASPYPAVTGPITIDGTTAPGFAGAPVVTIDGGATVATGIILGAGSDNSLLTGLKVAGFTTAGAIVSSSTVTIRGNYIGPVGGGTANLNGLVISAGTTGVTVGGTLASQRNVISGNTNDGITLNGSGHAVLGNFIGTDAAGTAALLNTNGINVLGSGNTIGTAAGRNVLSGNTFGVQLALASSANTISGNYIGVDATGTAALPNGAGVIDAGQANILGIAGAGNGNVISGNGLDGVVYDAASNNGVMQNNVVGLDPAGSTIISNSRFGVVASGNGIRIGGTSAGQGNVISGNGTEGITTGSGSPLGLQILGNIIGLSADGTQTRGNGAMGISISNAATTFTIGSVGAGMNVISGNSQSGILLNNTNGGIIEGNRIGTNGAGNASQGNLGSGIIAVTATGPTIRSNVISGNVTNGIWLALSTTGAIVHSNIVGLTADLSSTLANSGDGITVDNSSNNTIGSVALGGNTISSNEMNGIGATGGSMGNTFVANSIFTNGGLGIDLGENGVSPNDPGDPDEGANNLQNFPLLTTALTNGTQTFVDGTLNSATSTSFALHFYASVAADPSGNGEGQTYLGTTNVTTDGGGNASFTYTGPAVGVGQFITATATAGSGTSEFSNAQPVSAAPSVQFSSATYFVAENGGTATITVTRTGDLSVTSTVNYATSNGTATAGSDYTAASGTLTFAPTVASQTFNVPILDDTINEPNETVNLTLSAPVEAGLGAQTSAVLTINENDPAPTVSIGNITLAEGNSGTTNFVFSVDLSAPSAQTVTVSFASANGTATSPSDYFALSGLMQFNPGVTHQTITVGVNGDTTTEADETFTVTLSAPVNATIGTGTGTGTIVNDDATPAITISNVTQNEGNAGTTAFTFNLTLSNPSSSAVSVNYATADGTATAGSDYTATSGTLLFPAGITTQAAVVNVIGDTTFEPNETFFVNLTAPVNATIATPQATGTITNDDGVPSLAINDVTQAEGNAGTTNFVFTVTLSTAAGSPVTVDYATANGTATAGSDYTAANGTLTFAPGVLTQTITVPVIGDTTVEPNETFFVNLTSPANASIADNQGLGTITNDDVALTAVDLSIAKTAVVSYMRVTYTITVTNVGSAGATNVVVTDVLPPLATYISATPSTGSCSGSTTVTCTAPALAAGASMSITLLVAADANVGPNTATVTSAEPDANPVNNSATVSYGLPMLSTWVMILLGALLVVIAFRRLH